MAHDQEGARPFGQDVLEPEDALDIEMAILQPLGCELRARKRIGSDAAEKEAAPTETWTANILV